MYKLSITLFFIFTLASINASDLSFDEALVKSKSDEESLNSSQMQSLLEAQGSVIGKGFQACMISTSMLPHDFKLVMQLDSRGMIAKSWLKNKSKFSDCFKLYMKARFIYVTDREVFFTAIEYENK